MKRIDHSTAVAERFTEGDPAVGTPATMVTDDWLNQVQEEICTVVETAGITLDGALEDQLHTAIAAMIAAGAASNASTTVRGIVELATNTETTTGTDTERAVTPAGLAAALPSAASVDTIYIGGGAMTPSVTAGAVAAVVEDVVNHLSRSVLTFGATANTAGEFEFAMPDNWDGGTIKAKAHWTASSGTAGDNVGFLIAARALGDDDALDQALGTAVTLSDDLIVAGDLHITAASAALTVAGVPAGGKIMRVKITRDFDYGAAPLAADAQLLGVTIQHGITGALAAW